MTAASIILYIYFFFGAIMLALNASLVFFSIFNRRIERTYKVVENYQPPVSLIVPAHNEESVIERTILAFLNTTYNPLLKELIVVNDGSGDQTGEIIRKYAYTVIKDGVKTHNEANAQFRHVTLVERTVGGGGKASASNAGAAAAAGEIFFFIDADVQVAPDIFERAVRHFGDPAVGAVAGYVEIVENQSLLNGFMCFESVLAQKVMRAGFNVLGVQYVVPGGCAVFRKDIWKSVYGYAVGSLAEDTDLTWKVLMDTRKKIRFDSSIHVFADEPQTLQSLWNQRTRWARGNLEITLKHLHKVGNWKYGKGATHIYPYWLACTLMPFVFLFNVIGVLGAVYYHMNLHVALVNSILGVSFFISFIAGVIAGRGRALFPGLFSPGLPMLAVLIASVFYKDGVLGLASRAGVHFAPETFALILMLWIVLSIPLAYLMVRLSKKHETMAQIIQLFILGYWSVIMASSLYGYWLEATGHERTWIRTVR